MNNKKLNKFLSAALFFFVFTFIFSFQATAVNKIDLYFFYGEGCPHCSNAKPFLEKLKSEYSSLNVKSYEIYNNDNNRKLFTALGDAYTEDIRGVPAFFIGDNAFAGYAKSMDNQIRQLVENCLINNCESPIKRLNKKIADANINNQNNNQNKKITNNNEYQNKNNINNAKLDFIEKSKQEQDKNLKFIFLSIFVVLIAFFIFLKRIKSIR